ncbi:MAG TPA: hypothetical protein VFN48_07050 [Solirubrobacteraceae bacterium]|nr:hypothetical protein [Solirubrobacteraceae bacterium]
MAALGLMGCSGSGADPTTQARALLRETFSGHHPMASGRLHAELTVDPRGSSVLTQPLTLSFGGPFQSRGSHVPPASDFAIAITFQGHTGRLGIISTGTRGFVTLGTRAYTLPAAIFAQLERGVSAVGGAGNGTGVSPGALGIHPQSWLSDPRVVGSQTIAGTPTVHIHGALALAPLLGDLSTILARAGSVSSTTSALRALSPATQARLAGQIHHASFDLWTGRADHTLRKLSVTLTLPVSGSIRTQLGGLSQVTVAFTLAYSDIGRPQTVSAPPSAAPYSQFQQHLAQAVLGIEGIITSAASGAGAGGAGAGGAGAGVTGSGAAGGPSSVPAYSQCITAANGSVAKIQKCAALLNGGG